MKIKMRKCNPVIRLLKLDDKGMIYHKFTKLNIYGQIVGRTSMAILDVEVSNHNKSNQAVVWPSKQSLQKFTALYTYSS